jgi:hypothetical protein
MSSKEPMRSHRRDVRFALVLACLLAGTACDSLNLPALPARAGDATVHDSAAATPAAKPRRGAKPAAADPALDAGRFDQIRRGLRRLVAAEESFYAENGAYTEDLSRVGFAPEGETGIRFLWLSRDGWAASGTHPDLPGRDCVIYVGRAHAAPTTLKTVRSGREGVPVCDPPPVIRPAASASPRTATAPAAPAPATAVPPAAPPAATSAATPALPDTGSALDAVDPSVQMRVDLRNLVRSQDTYFGLQGVYARRTEPFALQYLWHSGVTITILSANDASWSAKATSARRPGKSCVIWLGAVPHRPATEAQRRVPERPGIPVCDD